MYKDAKVKVIGDKYELEGYASYYDDYISIKENKDSIPIIVSVKSINIFHPIL